MSGSIANGLREAMRKLLFFIGVEIVPALSEKTNLAIGTLDIPEGLPGHISDESLVKVAQYIHAVAILIAGEHAQTIPIALHMQGYLNEANVVAEDVISGKLDDVRAALDAITPTKEARIARFINYFAKASYQLTVQSISNN